MKRLIPKNQKPTNNPWIPAGTKVPAKNSQEHQVTKNASISHGRTATSQIVKQNSEATEKAIAEEPKQESTLNRMGRAWNRGWDMALSVPMIHNNGSGYTSGIFTGTSNGQPMHYASTPEREARQAMTMATAPIAAATAGTIGMPATVGGFVGGAATGYVGDKVGRKLANSLDAPDAENMFGSLGGFLGSLPGAKGGSWFNAKYKFQAPKNRLNSGFFPEVVERQPRYASHRGQIRQLADDEVVAYTEGHDPYTGFKTDFPKGTVNEYGEVWGPTGEYHKTINLGGGKTVTHRKFGWQKPTQAAEDEVIVLGVEEPSNYKPSNYKTNKSYVSEQEVYPTEVYESPNYYDDYWQQQQLIDDLNNQAILLDY